jgi:hypothetical protein
LIFAILCATWNTFVLIFFQETVITFIYFPAFPSDLLLIQQ